MSQRSVDGLAAPADPSNNLPERNVAGAWRLPGPKNRAERWVWLVSDARRILRSPVNHRAEEVAWAHDVLAADQAVRVC